MLFRFSLYGFLKNQRYFEPFLMLAFLEQQLSFSAIGWLVALRSLTVNLLEIPSGAIADTLGRRRIMVISIVAYAISFLMLGLAPTWHWDIPAMVLFGVGESFRTGTHKAMIFEWLRLNGRTDERTKIYGYTRSWSKMGSAVSSLVAAFFVLTTGNYRSVFVLSAIPCVANVFNLASYPNELDGEAVEGSGFSASVAKARQALRTVLDRPALRGLMAESMGWDGIFHAAKDYLQPVLAGIAILVAAKFVRAGDLTPTQQTALVVGPVYALLFVFSSIASRQSHRLTDMAGSLGTAAKWLWAVNLATFGLLLIAACFGWMLVACVAFVFLHVNQNVWRPVLISRFDDHAEPSEGATILSIESQSQRFATMLVAPIIGAATDITRGSEFELVPVAVAGTLACLFVLVVLRPHR